MEIYYIQDKKALFKMKVLDTTFFSLMHTYDIEKNQNFWDSNNPAEEQAPEIAEEDSPLLPPTT